MGAITPAHLLIILIVALVVLGPGKLPEAGKALGQSIRGFRDAASGKDEETTATPAATETDKPA